MTVNRDVHADEDCPHKCHCEVCWGDCPRVECAATALEANYGEPVEVVLVQAKGDWLVRDGEVIQVHQVRKEADFIFNRCSPDDPCGALDGCNVD